jgi:hypothetical protein
MCLNKTLLFNIKVKSRVCELMVLKKDDFLKLSINFKDLIEKFLKKSLYRFLKLAEDVSEIQDLIKNGIDDDEALPLDIIHEEEDYDDSDLCDNDDMANEDIIQYSDNMEENEDSLSDEIDKKDDKKEEKNMNSGKIN